MDEETPTEERETVDPNEIAEYLTGVYKDEETSNFEKLHAACALMHFWTAVQIAHTNDILQNFIAVPVGTVPMPPVDKEKML